MPKTKATPKPLLARPATPRRPATRLVGVPCDHCQMVVQEMTVPSGTPIPKLRHGSRDECFVALGSQVRRLDDLVRELCEMNGIIP